MKSLRRRLSRIRARLLGSRSRAVPAGPATGLRLGTEAASADYLGEANEVPVQEAIRDGLVPGAVFVDVGANIGFFSLMAARLVGPTGRVIAFEPVADNVAAIHANSDRNRLSIEVIAAAVGEEHEGTVRLWSTQHPGGATISSADVPLTSPGTPMSRRCRSTGCSTPGSSRCRPS